MFQRLAKLLRINKNGYFYNHNLDKWVYLGKTIISFSSGKPLTVIDSNTIYFFTDRNFEKRSYYISDIKYWNKHDYVGSCNEWKHLSVGWIGQPICMPSKELKSYVKDLGYVWSETTDWWERSNINPPDKDNNNENTNIIKINFNKDKNS